MLSDHRVPTKNKMYRVIKNEFLSLKKPGYVATPKVFKKITQAELAKNRYIENSYVGRVIHPEVDIRIYACPLHEYLEGATMDRLCGNKDYYQLEDVLNGCIPLCIS